MNPRIAPPARIATPLCKVAGEYFARYDAAPGGWDIVLRSPDFRVDAPVVKVFIDRERTEDEDYLGDCISRVESAMDSTHHM